MKKFRRSKQITGATGQPKALPALFGLFFLLFLSASVFAQNIRVSGRVTNEGNQPVPNVSVTVQGTSVGTTTSTDGSYSISVPGTGTLVFSSVGFNTQQVPVNNRTSIDITFVASAQQLEQVVVVGYGTARRRDITGSVSSVKGSDIAKQPVQTATQAIQGKVAGVQVISSGQPNSLPVVRVRGTGTMLGGANPLYVVDGVITDDIRNINSADIVSMDVLKDASATAIYGMRAANGVLLITTKKGRTGQMVIAYDANVGVREAAHLVNMAGANQYANYINEANIYYGSGDSVVRAAALAKGFNTDWYDAILRRGFQQNHNLSISGGSDRINYFLSAGFISEEGIVKTNNFNRFTLRSNNEYKLSNIIRLSSLVSYSRASLRDVDLGVFNNAYRAAPYVASKVGNLYGNTSLSNNVSNPLLQLDMNNNSGLENRVQGTMMLDVKPVSWLSLRSSYGVDLQFYQNTAYGYAFGNLGSTNVFIDQGGNQLRNKSSLTVTKNNATRWVWDNTATATKKFGAHNFTLLVGTTAEKYKFNSLAGTRVDVPSNQDQWFLGAGSTVGATNNNTGDAFSRNSYLSRLNYAYSDRYLISASFRADGTSRFAEGNRWGYFPSVGLGWNINREAFMMNQQTFSQLKLRASYGKVGNDQIPSSIYQPTASINIPYFFDQQTTQSSGIQLDELVDKNVKWEVTDEYDLGINFGVLKNKLSGELDFYKKTTKDALVVVNIPGILGDPDNKYITNAASFENKGVELSLNWNDRINTDWSYNVSGNIAYNKNQVLNLNGGQALFGGGVGDYFTTKSDNGQPIGSFFLRQYDGIFQTDAEIAASAQKGAVPGDIRYKDVSGPNGKPDGVIDDNDRVYSGSYQPKLTYGINGGLNYMAFDFSFGTYGTSGSKIYNGKKNLRGASPYDNVETEEAKDRWTPNNTNTGIPRASFGRLPASTYFLENGNFFRINNLTLGYTFNKAMLQRYKVASFRVYATAQNLATFTHYSGFTPELITPAGSTYSPGVLSSGIESNAYPTTRTWAVGVNLTF